LALLVQKFGGTSVGTTERIEAVAELIIRSIQAGHKVVAVVSAMAGDTNRLLGLARQIDARASARELDVLAASGEQVTVALLAIALIKRGYPAVSLLADQAGVLTDNKFGKARVEQVDTGRLLAELEQGHIAVVAGFQGRDIEGNLTTLGRGGSDTSAVVLAAALKADECQIFTDVDGVYTIDPRICPKSQRLPFVPADEMLLLAGLGAKVLHVRSVEYACASQVPLRVLSTFRPDAGTLISYQANELSGQLPAWSGIACLHGITLLRLAGVSATFCQQLQHLCIRRNFDIDMLMFADPAQGGDGSLMMSLPDQEYDLLQDELQALAAQYSADIVSEQRNLAKLSLVGRALDEDAAWPPRIILQLTALNAQVWAQYQSSKRLSVLMSAELLETAAKALHQLLFVGEN
jgi:aspartate kinase